MSRSLADDQVGQHHVLGAEAVGKDRRREVAGDVAQQTLDVGGFFGDGVEQFTVGKVGEVLAEHGRLLIVGVRQRVAGTAASGWLAAAW